MTIEVLAPYFACIATEDSFEEAKKDYCNVYVRSPDGSIYCHRKFAHGGSVTTKVKSIPGYTPPKGTVQIKEEVNFLPAGKVPYDLFLGIVKFFREVMKNNNNSKLEAMAHVLWNPTDGYHVAVPTQEVSGASVKYTHDHLKPGDIVVVDIHSHNSMSAFFSATDNKDDCNSVCYSGVVGKLTDTGFDTVWRMNVQDHKIDTKIDEIFEVSIPDTYNPEWMKKVKTMTYSGYQGYTPGKPSVRTGPQGYTSGSGYNKDTPHRIPANVNSAQSALTDWRQTPPNGVAKIGATRSLWDDEDTPSYQKKDLESANSAVDSYMQIMSQGDALANEQVGEYDYDLPGFLRQDMGYIDYQDDKTGMPVDSDIAMAFSQVDTWLDDLDGEDELLLKIINKAIEGMSAQAVARLQTNGL